MPRFRWLLLFLPLALVPALQLRGQLPPPQRAGSMQATTVGKPILRDRLAQRAGGLIPFTPPDSATNPQQSLNGRWLFRFDSLQRGRKQGWSQPQARYERWDTLPVPGCWDLAHPEGFNRQTVGWYVKRFRAGRGLGDNVRLHFGGVFRQATVWLNGHKLGRQQLPYLPFAFSVDSLLRRDSLNTLVVRVDNRLERFSLPARTQFHQDKLGWFPYGGITRPVRLVSGAALPLAQVAIRPALNSNNNMGRLQARLWFAELGPASRRDQLTLRARLFAPGGQEVMQFAAHRFNYRDSTYAEVRRGRQLSQGNTIVLQGRLPAPKRWSPARPGHVYTLQIEQQDTAGHWYKRRYRFAFKTFRTRAGHFLLNGEEVLLKGINRHEDHPAHGPVYNDSVLQADTRQMRRMGANFCRPGHYPNALHSLRTMEQQGLMLMEELPLYQLTGRQMRNEQLQALARRALRQLIIRDYNRPGVVMWSLANELYNWTPAAKRLLRQLHRIAKRMDPRRETHVAKVSLPLLVDRLLPDNSSAIPDVTGANLYFGWYLGTTDKATPYLRRLHRQWPEQPLLVSEFGAGALHGRRLAHPPGEEPNKQHSYSEEFQAYFLRQHLRQYRELPFIHGAMPWVWADFRMQWSPNTGTPHPKPLWNLKGLLSGDRRKKLGYRAVKSFYDQWRP